jgi:pyridoxal 5'-phosphate synthase pdxS subunit
MGSELPISNGGNGAPNGSSDSNFTVKTGLARMLQGGVIMDVVNAEQVLSHHCLHTYIKYEGSYSS